MLHPDKANGQQTRGHTRVPVILRTLLFAVFMGIAGMPDSAPAETAALREVRMADHSMYTRVVFEFSAPVQYQFSENTAAGIVSIRFLETTSQLPETTVSGTSDCINNVSTNQDGSHTITDISFASKKVRLSPFTIQNPDRMVLDVFCEAEPVATVALNESRDLTPASVTATAPPKEMPVTARPLMEQTQASKQLAQILEKSKPVPQRDNSQKYLLLLLAAITGSIVLLIALIIFQRRNLSEGHMAGGPDSASETDEKMRSLDTKIKEKFMKYDR